AMSKRRDRVRWGGLAAGPLVAVLLYQLLPAAYRGIEGEAAAFTHAGRATLAVMAWMAVWWLTEALPIPATALVPLAVFPLAGILPIGRAAAPYGSELIFLFMGGFVLALSMQRWGLDRRIALTTLRFVGTKPPNVIGGFMLVTATLSMWVSNTATVAMMLPIALSVVDLVFSQQHGRTLTSVGALPAEDVKGRNFALSLMLGIAYAASIGGIATIIGSPPNGILVQFLRSELDQEISFAQWMMIGSPLVAVFLPLAWVIITWVLYPIRIERIEGGRELVESELRGLGRMRRGEWITMSVFFSTAALWISRPLLVTWAPLEGLSDAGIAILAALALFVTPAERNPPASTMDWETAVKLPWGVLILFGGGLSLAAAVQANGVAEYLGAQVTALGGLPTVLFVLAVTAGVIFLTELTSNTATTATLVPVLAGVAYGIGVHPDYLIFPATIAASCAFMMPVATPPNAIVFGSGYVTIPQMCKAGLWLNLAGIVLITVVMYLVVIPLLGLGR
ncbi:MAG TPA: DASS family sodium-coupled anion symporter, partial [Thermoanaerobaculia bacterium]|nr:DASS family sodium-coupled anion symporter [Thermoanaerobaculia bacterium]